MKLVYVLLDGVGDLPHPALNNLTPLEAAYTPNLDSIARKGAMGVVYSVGKGIAPESDIAVLSMLGYRFRQEDYVGRGVIEAIGAGIDFRDGDLALRGNFATVDKRMNIVDRRAGRAIERHEAEAVARTVQDSVKLAKASFVLLPTTGHRVVLSIRAESALSADITNTDLAYGRIKGMGVARSAKGRLKVATCKPMNRDASSKRAAQLVNEFTKKSVRIMDSHEINKNRKSTGKPPMNCILLRDAGNRLPRLDPISKLHGMNFCCIVDMPVERGIAKATAMQVFEGGGINDYEEKARTAARCLEQQDAVYVHIKGPDEFGHDGDAKGKKKSIEDIDRRFFGTLLHSINSDVSLTVSGDHSTPCIKMGHSADPVPLLVSGSRMQNDSLARFTESNARRGRLGMMRGADVLSTAIKLIRS